MINFLRKIRHQFIDQQNAKKYFLYAVGEIILIVVGILIALQINNWNISKKNHALEIDLLKGIQANLVSDTIQINNRFYPSYYDLKKSIVVFDSVIKLKDSEIDLVYLDSIFNRCVRQRSTFWPTSGTYQTIINNSSSNIFRNKELYTGFQSIYNTTFEIVVNSGKRIDNLSDQNRYKFNFVYVLGDKEKLDFYRNPNTMNEVNYWFTQINDYEGTLVFAKQFAKTILIKIEEELAN